MGLLDYPSIIKKPMDFSTIKVISIEIINNLEILR